MNNVSNKDNFPIKPLAILFEMRNEYTLSPMSLILKDRALKVVLHIYMNTYLYRAIKEIFNTFWAPSTK